MLSNVIRFWDYSINQYSDFGVLLYRRRIQRLLLLAETHSNIFGYIWNPLKCEVLNCPLDITFQLYNTNIPTYTYFKYFGILFSSHVIDKPKLIAHSRNKALQAMWSLKSSGVHRYQFEHGLLHVAPHVQTLFVPSDDCPGHFDDQPLLYCFLTASAWSTCSSRQFRIEQMTLLLDNITSIPFPPASWLFFWKFPNLPEVRSLWYKLI